MLRLHHVSNLVFIGIHLFCAICADGSSLSPLGSSPPFITRGGSTKALKKYDDSSHINVTSYLIPKDITVVERTTSLLGESIASQDDKVENPSPLFVKKKDGRLEPIDKLKILRRL